MTKLPCEKVDDYASELKQLFKQAYPDEGLNSAGLLQKFLTGLLASIACQMLLKKKPVNLSEAIKDAVSIEYVYISIRVVQRPKLHSSQLSPLTC